MASCGKPSGMSQFLRTPACFLLNSLNAPGSSSASAPVLHVTPRHLCIHMFGFSRGSQTQQHPSSSLLSPLWRCLDTNRVNRCVCAVHIESRHSKRRKGSVRHMAVGIDCIPTIYITRVGLCGKATLGCPRVQLTRGGLAACQSQQLLVRRHYPISESLQTLLTGESMHHLHCVDNADPVYALCVVRPQEQRQLDQAHLTHPPTAKVSFPKDRDRINRNIATWQ